MSRKSVMIIAGEVSGDMHAAGLVNAIKKHAPDITFFGIGGDEMRSAGVEVLYHVSDMAVMGFSEVLHRLPFFRRVFHAMVRLVKERRPDAVILVDYPGFNLRFASRIRSLGVKTIYYICPQVWAWNRSRIPGMAEVVNLLITIFPFEKKHFEGTGLRVEFAGHPLVESAQRTWEEPQTELPLKGAPLIALLPGSRIHVIERMLPVMWRAASLIEKGHPDASFIIASPSQAIGNAVRGKLETMGKNGPARCSIVEGETRQVLRQSKAAMVASGTATVEASLMLCPMVVVYKMSPLSYMLGRMLVRLDHIGMVNLLAGRRLCPELIQDRATPEAIAGALSPLLDDTPARLQMIQGLKEANSSLGPTGSSDRASQVVLQFLGNCD